MKNLELGDRTKYIGGSDIAAIVGKSRYRTPYDVWLEKTGRAKPQPLNRHMLRGLTLEPLVLEQYAKTTAQQVESTQAAIPHPKYDFILGHVDGLLRDRIVEVKCPSFAAFERMKRAGILPEYEIQALIYAGLSRKDQADIVLFCADQWEMLIKSLEFNSKQYEELIEQAVRFWKNYVKKDIPPPISLNNSEEDEEKEEAVNLSSDPIFSEWEKEAAAIEEAYQEIAEARDMILAQGLDIVNRKPGKYQGERLRLAVWETKPRETFDYKRFIEDHPNFDPRPYLRFSKASLAKRVTLIRGS